MYTFDNLKMINMLNMLTYGSTWLTLPQAEGHTDYKYIPTIPPSDAVKNNFFRILKFQKRFILVSSSPKSNLINHHHNNIHTVYTSHEFN